MAAPVADIAPENNILSPPGYRRPAAELTEKESEMPRLDNSDETVITVYALKFDDNDPGATPPIDLCTECWRSWLDAGLEIEHPDYDDDEYRCHECDILLTANDNRY